MTSSKSKLKVDHNTDFILNGVIKSLSDQLRDLCNKNGEEIEDQLESSAEIFHKMALQYKQSSPDKLSLLRCVGLLNTAISRNPKNLNKIKADLNDICLEILGAAGAKRENADLIRETKTVHRMIHDMRSLVQSQLGEVKKSPSVNADDDELLKYKEFKVESIRRLQHEIKTRYIDIMKRLSGICQDIMGDPPCKYAVIGMGSLVCSEMTPYSNFEHLLVLENGCEKRKSYPRILEYFRWFSVIFHVIILNLQETIIPSLDIDCLDWFHDKFTKRGISFHSLVSYSLKVSFSSELTIDYKPWATNLIQPVDKMLNHLKTNERLRNTIDLSGVLNKTCYIYGSKELSNKLKNKIKHFIDAKIDHENLECTKKEVIKSFGMFSVKSVISNIRQKEKGDTKVFYCCTIFYIAVLGQIYNITGPSCFEIVWSLFNKGIITKKTKLNLLYAVALACEMRLRCYMKEERQADEIQLHLYGEKDGMKFESILGAQNTIKYFQIVYCLQYLVANYFKIDKVQFYSNPLFLNIFLRCAFQSDKKVMLLSSKSNEIRANKKKSVEFDELLEVLEENITIISENFKREPDQSEKIEKAKVLKQFGNDLIDRKVLDDALHFFKCSYLFAFQVVAEENQNPENQKLFREAEKIKADSLIGQLQCMTEDQISLDCSQEALEIYRRISTNPEEDSDLVTAMEFVGKSYLALNKKETATLYLQNSACSEASKKLE